MSDISGLAANHPWALHHYAEIPPTFPNKEPFAVLIDNLVFAGRLDRASELAEGLLVMLCGTVGPPGVRPVLQNRTAGRALGYQTLVISDPSLFLDPEMDTGVFLGPEATDPIDGVVELSRAVARSRKIPDERIVFAGSSSGGFAAIKAASKSGLKAIACNSPLDLPAMAGHPATERLARNFRPGITPYEVAVVAPERCIAEEAVKAARASGLRPRIALFQNVQDPYHLKAHFIPFCKAVGAVKSGGVSSDGSVLTTRLDYPEGHSVPEHIRNEILRVGTSFLRA